MEKFWEVLNISVGAKSVGDYVYAVGLFFVLLIVFILFRSVVVRSLKRVAQNSKTNFDDKLVDVFESISFPFYLFIALYFPLKHLAINPSVDKFLTAFFLVAVVVQTILFLEKFLALCFSIFDNEPQSKTAFNGINLIIKILLWSVGGLLVLSNLGFDITTLIASLGIGGIAIALAVQNILGDIFSSFSIYFDKPFKVGDFIVIGADSGTVKKIGLKTTRLESLSGEELVIPNKELTSIRVQNFKKMKRRRVVLQFGLVYNTDEKKLVKVVDLVKVVVKKVKDVEFGRAHLIEFADSALKFEVIYFVLSGEYDIYRDRNQEILFGLKKAFDENKIQFAFPTTTVHLEK